MSGFDYFKDVLFNKYAQFDGRARRSEYWYFSLFSTIISWTVMGLDSMVGFNIGSLGIGGLGMIYSLAVFVPGLAVGIRRLHDIGKSGWMWLIVLIPIAGIIWLLVLFVKDSEEGENQYGPNPKTEGGLNIQDNLI